MPTSQQIEARIHELGSELLASLRRADASPQSRLLNFFFTKLNANRQLRTRTLRFIDVLPSLESDVALLNHLQEYFGDDQEPIIPPLLRWGLHPPIGGAAVAASLRLLLTLFARHFMGGANHQEAFTTIKALRRQGSGFSLDLLGEAAVSEREAERYCQDNLDLLKILPERLAKLPEQPLLDRIGGQTGPRLYLSVKLSSLYSQINPLAPATSFEALANRLRPLFRSARRQHAGLCLDMEHYDIKQVVIECFTRLLDEAEFRDWPDAGLAIQAYLRDSEKDLAALIRWAKTRPAPVTIRLVRGAYWDQETVLARQQNWPSPVWDEKAETDACYERCLRLLMTNTAWVRPAVASHNIRSIALALALAEAYQIPPDRYEFQMLFGMAGGLQRVIPQRGHCLRVYVPCGATLPGIAYLVRRLLENSSSQSFSRMILSSRGDPAELLAAPQASSPQHAGPQPALRQRPPGSDPPPFRNQALWRFTAMEERESFAAALKAVRKGLGQTYPLRIGGRAVFGQTLIESRNPAHPSELIGRVVAADQAQAEAALAAATAAWPHWAGRSPRARAQILLRTADLLRERRLEFAALEVLEAGKNWREADANVCEAIDFLGYYAREALRLGSPRRHDVAGETNRQLYRPRGVGVILPPWNFPLAILTGMLSAALVTGNTAVLKPSSQTPVIAARFVELLLKAGLPASVVQFLPGAGSRIGDFLVSHPAVHFIAFTGSREVGTRIIRLASETAPGQRHLKRVIAEMGGKNAIIVDDDADLDQAIPGVIQSAFGYQGQKCSACSRVIVVGAARRTFLPRLLEAARSITIGDPADPAMFMGPVINTEARERIQQRIAAAAETAHLELTVNCDHLREGYFLGPTVFSGVSPDSILAQEEIFGPVLAVMAAESFEQALTLANDSDYALTGGLYSRSPSHIDAAAAAFQVGNLYINRKITGALVQRQPFGGFRLSGYGNKAGGPDYLLQFLNPVTLTENTLRHGYAGEFDVLN